MSVLRCTLLPGHLPERHRRHHRRRPPAAHEVFSFPQQPSPVRPRRRIHGSRRDTGADCSPRSHGGSRIKGQKSEKLIERIKNAHTEEGDIVLDFFGGAGTTGAVAHKMKRKYILVEQLDRHTDIIIRRLQKVIEGEQSGISKKYNWKGGGSFVYCELKENAMKLINRINKSTEQNIDEIKNDVYNDDKIISFISKSELEKGNEEFEKLTFEEKKKALIALIDKNKLYVNLSDIEDKEFNVSEADKEFTESFYKGVQQ